MHHELGNLAKTQLCANVGPKVIEITMSDSRNNRLHQSRPYAIDVFPLHSHIHTNLNLNTSLNHLVSMIHVSNDPTTCI